VELGIDTVELCDAEMYEIIYTQREREREKRYPLETLLDFE
jgi:hypothetical protein